MTTAVRKN